MLEFALGSFVMVALFVGTFRFGFTFLQYNNLENAVNRAARYASLVPYDSINSTPSAAFKTAVQNMAVYGQPTAGASSVLPNLTTANVDLTVGWANGIPSTMTVFVTNYTINSVFSSTTVNSKPRVTYVYQGIWTPIP
jgi:Flp pilus assembly protein TadG